MIKTDEMQFIIDIFWKTVNTSKENIGEGALLAAMTVLDDEKLLSIDCSVAQIHLG